MHRNVNNLLYVRMIRRYAIVSAILIYVDVATSFLNYFQVFNIYLKYYSKLCSKQKSNKCKVCSHILLKLCRSLVACTSCITSVIFDPNIIYFIEEVSK